VLCVLGPPPAAPARRSSQHCWHRSKANKAGRQQGKEKTSRVLRKIKSGRLGLFYSRMILVQHQFWMLGGWLEKRRGTRVQVMKFKMKQ